MTALSKHSAQGYDRPLREGVNSGRFVLRIQFAPAVSYALLFWLAAIVFPLYGRPPPETLYDLFYEEGPNVWLYLAPLPALALNVLLFRSVLQHIRFLSRNNRGVLFLCALFLLTGIAGALGGAPSALLYACIAIFLCINLSLVWRLPAEAIRRFAAGGALVLLAYMLGAILLKGVPDGRWVGGIHPNLYGGAALAAFCFALLAGGRTAIAMAPVTLVLATMVSSRFAMVAIVLAALIMLAWTVLRAGRVGRTTSIAASVGLIVAAALSLGTIESFLYLDSAYRGFASGATGRFTLYHSFMPQLLESWAFGFGFRQRDAYTAVHNGFLNLLLENGIVIGSALILFLTYKLMKFGLSAWRHRSIQGAALFASLSAIAFGAFFQPQLVNFGDPVGLVTLFILCAPSVGQGAVVVRESTRERAA